MTSLEESYVRDPRGIALLLEFYSMVPQHRHAVRHRVWPMTVVGVWVTVVVGWVHFIWH